MSFFVQKSVVHCSAKGKVPHRIHEEDGVGSSDEDAVGILVACELKAKCVDHIPLQTHRLRRNHKPTTGSSHQHSCRQTEGYDGEYGEVTDLAPAGRDTRSLSSSGMVFPQGLLVGIGPGRMTDICTSSQSRGICTKNRL